MPGLNMVAPETLLPLIGAHDAPVLIDVCLDEDFALDPRLIPGAFRYPYMAIEALAPNLADREVVIICQKGLKLSQGAAALLRANGAKARTLTGGMVDWVAKGHPAIRAAALPAKNIVAPEDPSPDALAALWLVKRFARRDAQILFVAPNTGDAVAGRFGATPLRSFVDQQSDLRLNLPMLTRLAETISGDAKESAGVARMLTGLRALHPDDLSYMEASLPLFDALRRAFCDASDTQMKTGAAA